MNRVYLPPSAFVEGRAVVSGAERHHLVDVLRVRPGDRFLATDGEGREYLLETTSVERGTLVASRLEEHVRPPGPGRSLVLAIAPPKGGRMEVAVEKTVECGVGRIVPIRTARSVVRSREDAGRVERWRRVACSAVAQSGLTYVPEISPVCSLREALEEARSAGVILLAHPGLNEKSVAGALAGHRGGTVTLFVGPEGGFTDEELEEASGRGATYVSLGPTRLRTETAAIVAVALVLASMTGGAGSSG